MDTDPGDLTVAVRLRPPQGFDILFPMTDLSDLTVAVRLRPPQGFDILFPRTDLSDLTCSQTETTPGI